MTQARRSPRPFIFFVLIIPFGASFGFVSVALPYLATHRGISVAAIGAVVAAAFLPHSVKFLWAPVVDETLTKKTWYLIALALTAAGTVASAVMPISVKTLGALEGVVLASQFGLTLLGMTCEAFIGHGVSDELKGKASGWYQAGNFAGLGVGGGAALWLAQHLPRPWMAGAVMAAVFFLCAIPLLTFDEPERVHAAASEMGRVAVERLKQALAGLGRDLKMLFTSRVGLIGAGIALSSIGAGAASNYFSALSSDWHASLNVVALVTGAVGGIVSAAGAMAGGALADRMQRRLAYGLCGALTALTALAMAFGPRTSLAYIVFTLAYSFCNGAAFACFCAFVLETIGRGAVATKYNIFASLANFAIFYTTRADGAANKHWGATGLLLADAVLTGCGIVVLLTLVSVFKAGPELAPATDGAGQA